MTIVQERTLALISWDSSMDHVDYQQEHRRHHLIVVPGVWKILTTALDLSFLLNVELDLAV